MFKLPFSWGGIGSSGGEIGSAGGYQAPNSASNQASQMDLNQYLSLISQYSDLMTSSQKNANEDLMNKAMSFNESQANIDRDRQDRAYQIMVKDLEKAGLSKYLAYNNNPSAIQSVGASISTPNVARGSDLTSALASMSNTNANKMSGLLGSIVQLVFGLASSIGSLSDFNNKK